VAEDSTAELVVSTVELVVSTLAEEVVE
jgi:hypothetical protein